jgi:diguanylate cyclase (GGDEF)-like protein
MNLALVNLAILIAVAAVMCASMTMGWLYFGRLRYAQLWAFSAAGGLLQWTLSAYARAAIPDAAWPLFITGALVANDSMLAALGARHRARLPMHLPWFIGGTLLATAIMGYGVMTGNLAMRGFVANFYAATMLLLAASALLPRDRPAYPPEMVGVTAFGLFALFQYALAILALGVDSRYMLTTGQMYRDALIVGLPAAYAGLGVAAVFVLANDLNDKLRGLATRDPLTGALNRRGLEQAASNAFAIARRHGRELSVVLFSIDRFDAARKANGHDAMDSALSVMADIVHASVREEDLLARTGPAEFCLLLFGSDPATASGVVERARQEIAEVTFGGRAPFSLTVSVGVTAFRPDDVTLANALERADAALCRAVEAGGNRTIVSADLDR